MQDTYDGKLPRLTVSELTSLIKTSLEGSFFGLTVEGEISGYDPDVVVISVGAHNKASNTPDQIAAAKRRIAALVRAHAPRAEVRMQKD